jgi:hypothetical protein
MLQVRQETTTGFVILHYRQEQAYYPGQARKENVRPARSQARDLQRRQNQVIDFLPCEKKPVSHDTGFFLPAIC